MYLVGTLSPRWRLPHVRRAALPITARQADRHLSLGYLRFSLDGSVWLGHEFHYTQFPGETPISVTPVCNAKGASHSARP